MHSVHTLKMLRFCWKCALKNCPVKKMKLMSSHEELILMFLNKKKRERRFWFPWNSYKKAHQGRFDGLIPELKLYHHRFHISGCQWGSLSSCQHSWDHIWGCRERILESWLTQSKSVSHTDTAIKAEKNKLGKLLQWNYVISVNSCIRNRWIQKIFLTHEIFAQILLVYWCLSLQHSKSLIIRIIIRMFVSANPVQLNQQRCDMW